MNVCLIWDFSLLDVVKPEASRTRWILSGVVNYIRYLAEANTFVLDTEQLRVSLLQRVIM